ncbi:hypothetical protein BDF20DRAFT_900961 [Mycotypha africana]|uniref:uncharacterized protein n=1 Tax=Mycotypha africana TaxID=64632 RepID=UPI00230196AB|nr:uncharacterized protein BDF20DRAFT_900961 [Mycotypha africana]KAI8967419.1 hypothetical protein BDF20DRAFT_900961 [Mycotypha africana]
MGDFLEEPQTPQNQLYQRQLDPPSTFTPSYIMANLTLNSTSTRYGRSKQIITNDNAFLYRPKKLTEEFLIKASQQQELGDSNVHPNLNMWLDRNSSRIKVANHLVEEITEEDIGEDEEIIEIEEEIEIEEDESDEGSLLPVTPERPTATGGLFMKVNEDRPMTISERNHCLQDLFMDEDEEEEEDEEGEEEEEMRPSTKVYKEQTVKDANAVDTSHDWVRNIHQSKCKSAEKASSSNFIRKKLKGKEKDVDTDKENTIPYHLRYSFTKKDDQSSVKGTRSRHWHNREEEDGDKVNRLPLSELPIEIKEGPSSADKDLQPAKKKQNIVTENGQRVVQRRVLRTLSPPRLAPRKSPKGKEPVTD